MQGSLAPEPMGGTTEGGSQRSAWGLGEGHPVRLGSPNKSQRRTWLCVDSLVGLVKGLGRFFSEAL